MHNCVFLKVTNVHQAKVNEHDESELKTRSRSFSGLWILFLLISNSHIIDLINFCKVQRLPSYLRNVQFDECRVRIWSLYRTGGRLNGSCLARMLTSPSITCCCQGQQGMPSLLYQLILRLPFLLIFISWFSWLCHFTRVPTCQSLH